MMSGRKPPLPVSMASRVQYAIKPAISELKHAKLIGWLAGRTTKPIRVPRYAAFESSRRERPTNYHI